VLASALTKVEGRSPRLSFRERIPEPSRAIDRASAVKWDPEATTVTFVIPTFRRPGVLRATLAALMELDYSTSLYDVIVVDDGSRDSTPAVVAEYKKRRSTLYYVSSPNRGAAHARNLGATLARGKLVIFLDDDMIVAPDHILRHLDAQRECGDCLVNGHWEFEPTLRRELESTPFGRFRLEAEEWVRSRLPVQRRDDGRWRATEISGANLGMPRDVFRCLGGFDEAFPFAGREDADLARRAHRAGFLLIYDPTIKLLHNDARVSLEQFCARQRRGAVTFVYLAARYPAEFAGTPLMVENMRPAFQDPPSLLVKKLCKVLLSRPVGRDLLRLTARILEHLAPRSWALRRVYRLTVGVYIFLGIQEGIARLGTSGTGAESSAGTPDATCA